MIQEITPHRFDNRYKADAPVSEDAFILHFRERFLLLKTGGDEPELPRKKDLPLGTAATPANFLFTLDGTPCFLVHDQLQEIPSEMEYRELSFFRTTTDRALAWISITAYHLMNWYVQNRFCGKCGSATQHKPDERALLCPECATVVYPKIAPAIIVAVCCGDKLLLARNANFPGRWYSLIAGYADIGESLEETVVREVKEEVGVDVWNIRYYSSQPWPLSGSMMVGFIAEADAKQPIVVDEKEITEAAWFTRGNLPEHPPKLSISGEMIGKFEAGEW
jgi:NAD+ diphosphatase